MVETVRLRSLVQFYITFMNKNGQDFLDIWNGKLKKKKPNKTYLYKSYFFIALLNVYKNFKQFEYNFYLNKISLARQSKKDTYN